MPAVAKAPSTVERATSRRAAICGTVSPSPRSAIACATSSRCRGRPVAGFGARAGGGAGGGAGGAAGAGAGAGDAARFGRAFRSASASACAVARIGSRFTSARHAGHQFAASPRDRASATGSAQKRRSGRASSAHSGIRHRPRAGVIGAARRRPVAQGRPSDPPARAPLPPGAPLPAGAGAPSPLPPSTVQ